MCKYIALAMLYLLAATPGQAGELIAMEAGSLDLGGFHGVVYYTSERDGYRVVATIAEGETGLPVRFEATLTERQKVTISVPGKLGEKTHVLELTRAGGKLVLVEPQNLTDEAITASPTALNE